MDWEFATKKEQHWLLLVKPNSRGRLAVCAGTTGPGSTHLVAGLYEAARDHAPVLALSTGDMPRKNARH